jgi:hypothetical protein
MDVLLSIYHHNDHASNLLLGIEVVEKNVAFLALLAPVTDHDAGAVDDFAWVAFAIDLAYEFHTLAPHQAKKFTVARLTYKAQPTPRVVSHPAP